ncbi:hypothetical protein EDD37DRAFT_653763 [Exophiala viscosa]|uniref:Uncharacterized protein n=1 Tax=Exophiala viscosa TaxID=2486360 RepID=A0AAN6DR36_9EURO|nr:hypothetical protein EDD36DRAFT_468215 [Exophiala viscosa]KAI1620707.1 hypothetical protein EDD37DRAFT_653763 [Exophiala viscosa]
MADSTTSETADEVVQGYLKVMKQHYVAVSLTVLRDIPLDSHKWIVDNYVSRIFQIRIDLQNHHIMRNKGSFDSHDLQALTDELVEEGVRRDEAAKAEKSEKDSVNKSTGNKNGYLRETYKVTDVGALEAAERSFAELNFDPSEPVMAFVGKVCKLQEDINDAQGTCSDLTVMNKITRNLPTDQYSAFLNRVEMYNSTPHSTPMLLKRRIYDRPCGHTEVERGLQNEELQAGNENHSDKKSEAKGDEHEKKGKVDRVEILSQITDLQEQLAKLTLKLL